MQTVDIKGVGKAQFPDSMPQEQISAFLRDKYTLSSIMEPGTLPIIGESGIENRYPDEFLPDNYVDPMSVDYVPRGDLPAAIASDQQINGMTTPPEWLHGLASDVEGVGREVGGAAETMLAMGTGGASQVASGYLGAAAAPMAGLNVANDIIKGTQDAFTYQPRSAEAQRNMQAMQQYIGEPIQDAAQGTGDYLLESTDSPLAATIGHTLVEAGPDIAGSMLGMKFQPKGAARYEFSDVDSNFKQGGNIARAQKENVDKIISDPKIDVGGQDGFDKMTGEAPIVNPEALVGRTIVPTLADMTGAGRSFKGVDSSQTMPIELQGGPGFPMLDSYHKNNIVWAVNDKGGLTKLQKGDIIAVSAMNPKAHRSNATVTQSFLSTLDSYVTDGRVNKGNLRKINSMIKSDKDFKGFPGLENQDAYHQWAEDLTFEKRSKFTKLLESSKSQALGAPNFQKILNETIDPEFAGYNQGDNMLLIEVDKSPDARVELGKDGTKKHRSYKYGVKGKVIGKFAKPVSSKSLFPDFYNERRAKGADEGKDYRSFQLKLPSQMFTKEMAESIGNKPFKSIQSPRQAKLTQDFLDDNWKDSRTAKKDGGVSVTDFAQALKDSDASATLTMYDPKDLNKGIRSGDTSIHQLGDSEIYFALKDGYDYNNEYGVDLRAAGLTNNEKAVVGVVNNEKGAKGVAGTSVMLKAIKEGATVLDAFSVKSAKFPNGFLPSLYGKYGFQEVAKVPFEPKYYSKLELKDLEKTWSESGWDKSQGYPDVSVMKWKGDDSARKTIKQDWLNAIKTGDVPSAFGQPKAEFIANAEEAFSEYGGSTADGVRGAGNASNDPRSIRTSNGAPNNRGFAGVVNELQGLSDAERVNLGLQGLGYKP